MDFRLNWQLDVPKDLLVLFEAYTAQSKQSLRILESTDSILW